MGKIVSEVRIVAPSRNGPPPPDEARKQLFGAWRFAPIPVFRLKPELPLSIRAPSELSQNRDRAALT